MATTSFEDFYKVPNLKFDISRLRGDLEKILKDKTKSQMTRTPLKVII